jgi:hypothetical protein
VAPENVLTVNDFQALRVANRGGAMFEKTCCSHSILTRLHIATNSFAFLSAATPVIRSIEGTNRGWCWEPSVIALAVSPHSLPFIRLQHAQLNNDPYLSFLKPSHEITQQEDEHKTRR